MRTRGLPGGMSVGRPVRHATDRGGAPRPARTPGPDRGRGLRPGPPPPPVRHHPGRRSDDEHAQRHLGAAAHRAPRSAARERPSRPRRWPRASCARGASGAGGGRGGGRDAARSAAASRVHMAMTPQSENGVGERRRSASITSGGLVIHRPPTCSATVATSAAPTEACARRPRGPARPGSLPPTRRGWRKQERQARDPREAGRHVDRLAPLQERTAGRDGDRHAHRRRQRAPDQGRGDGRARSRPPGAAAPAGRSAPIGHAGGRSTKSALRDVSLALGMTGRRNTVSNPPPRASWAAS